MNRTWLIRTPDLFYSRPLPEDLIIKKIEAGEISAQDEICPASGHWFSIQEVDQVTAHFGAIHLKALIPDASEVTSTNTTRTQAIQLQGKPFQKREFARAAVVRPQVNSVPDSESEEGARPSGLAFGLILGAIFLGTLVMLWLGSR